MEGSLHSKGGVWLFNSYPVALKTVRNLTMDLFESELWLFAVAFGWMELGVLGAIWEEGFESIITPVFAENAPFQESLAVLDLLHRGMPEKLLSLYGLGYYGVFSNRAYRSRGDPKNLP